MTNPQYFPLKFSLNVSTDFSNIQKGEAVWVKGHIGVYIGDGKVIECTPKWSVSPGVKISYLENLGFKGGYSRTWTKHGFLPWVNYTEKKEHRRKIALQRVVKEPPVFSRKMLCHKKNLIIYLKGDSVYGTHRKQNNYT